MPAPYPWRALLLGLAVLCLGSAAAQAQKPFFQDRQITIVANYAQGGPTDAEARLLARHLGQHLAGRPSLSVRNMPGARGAAAATWLAATAPADGLTLGYLTDVVAMSALGTDGAPARLVDLVVVAARTGIAVAFARTATGSGLKRPADLLAQRSVVIGGQSPEHHIDIRLRMQFDLLGLQYRYASGFENASASRQAFQHAEIDVLMEPLTAYTVAIEPTFVDRGMALPLWIDPVDDGRRFSRSPAANSVAALTFPDFLLARTGSLPSSDLFRAWRTVNQIGTRFLRVLALPPGAPPAVVEALRDAIGRLADDQAFREDAVRSLRLVPQFDASPQLDALYRDVLQTDPRVSALIRSYATSAPTPMPAKGSSPAGAN